MKRFLDLIILFIFTFLYTQAFNYARATTFAITLFPIYFGLIFTYFILAILYLYEREKFPWIPRAKLIVLILIITITIAKTFVSAIALKHQYGVSYPVHDNPIQIEQAVIYLKQFKNPYTENYLGTEQEAWYKRDGRDVFNVALWHVVTLPFYLLFSLALSFPFAEIFGYFDERMVHVIMLIISVLLISKIAQSINDKIIYLTLFLFNPTFIHFFIEGRNDIFVYTLVFLSMYLLWTKRFQWSALCFGLAFASKQSSWLLLPFYFTYIYFLQDKKITILQKIRQVWLRTWPFFVTVVVFFVPFLIWDGKSFIEDIYLYPGGGLPTSYPISGFGFSQLLLSKNIIPNDSYNYPFWVWQVLIGVPLMLFLVIYLKKFMRISLLIFSYAAFILIFWLFSRFFADNYTGYVIMLIIMGTLFYQAEKSEFTSADKNKLIAKKARSNPQ